MSDIAKQRLIAIILLVAVGFFGYILFRPPEQAYPPVTAPQAAVITINEDSFSPATLMIHPGTEVVWHNDDQNPHLIESDPFPSHSDVPGLDSQTGISSNDTYQYTFNQKGTFGYHDKLNPTEYHGTIIVQ